MSYEYASDAIDVVSIAMVVIAIGIIWSRSIGLGLILLSVQSVLLALGGLHAGIATEEWHVVLGAALTFTAKAVVAPLLLWRIVSRPEVSHDVHASVGQGWSTIAAVITALALARALAADPFQTAIGAERVLPTSITIILIGVQIMITHRQALMQVVGFLVLENGMALAALTAFYGMPMVIELGIFLDLLLAVFVAFVYSQRMHLAFGSLDTLHFRSLRG
jgi:hydrogenase-4 component E